MVKISAHYSDTDFSWPLQLNDKITLFIDRILYWQLDIADKCINGEKDRAGNYTRQPLADSGLAVLSIVLSYFEMIAKYRDGYQNRFRAKEFLKKELDLFFQFCPTIQLHWLIHYSILYTMEEDVDYTIIQLLIPRYS